MGFSTHILGPRNGKHARRGCAPSVSTVDAMDTKEIETVIIGAGQAGLAAGYHLQRRGRPFVILDANTRVGDNWRRHPTKDEVGNYLEAYARHFDLPIVLGALVAAVERHGTTREVEVTTPCSGRVGRRRVRRPCRARC